ncbi:MAG: tetratricopeptide repeat protein, partial [Campylobacterota bacterium]|nr:tetratricopeptide repeat protein [Campylobacterota bacterium]
MLDIDNSKQNSFILESLESNDELELLIDSIDFSDESIFNIILCSNKTVVDQLLYFIDKKLESLGNKKNFIDIFKKRVIELDSLYVELDVFIKNISIDKKDMIILDLSFLESNKAYETEQIFSKLNQLRNSLMNYKIPVLLIFPKQIQKVFMVSAPDFWSIRSCVVSIDIILETKKEDKKSSLKDEKVLHKGQLSLLLNEYKRLKTLKNDTSRWLLMAKCTEIGDFYSKHDSLQDAFSYYKQALKLSESILEKRPDSVEAKRDLSVSLEKIADIYLQKGEITKALENYQEGLKLAESILEKRPDSIEAKRDLSVSLNKIADIYLQKGEITKALENYQEGLKLRESILEKRPDSIEAKRDLSVSLEKIADIYLQK